VSAEHFVGEFPLQAFQVYSVLSLIFRLTDKFSRYISSSITFMAFNFAASSILF